MIRLPSMATGRSAWAHENHLVRLRWFRKASDLRAWRSAAGDVLRDVIYVQPSLITRASETWLALMDQLESSSRYV